MGNTVSRIIKLALNYCLFQLHDSLFRHFLVYVAVAAEGAGVLYVTGNLGNQVGVLDFLIKVTDQDAAGHV